MSPVSAHEPTDLITDMAAMTTVWLATAHCQDQPMDVHRRHLRLADGANAAVIAPSEQQQSIIAGGLCVALTCPAPRRYAPSLPVDIFYLLY